MSNPQIASEPKPPFPKQKLDKPAWKRTWK